MKYSICFALVSLFLFSFCFSQGVSLEVRVGFANKISGNSYPITRSSSAYLPSVDSSTIYSKEESPTLSFYISKRVLPHWDIFLQNSILSVTHNLEFTRFFPVQQASQTTQYVQVGGGARFYPLKSQKFQPYAILGAGIVFAKILKETLPYTDSYEPDSRGLPQKVAIQVGLGAKYLVTEHIGISTEFCYGGPLASFGAFYEF